MIKGVLGGRGSTHLVSISHHVPMGDFALNTFI